MADHTKDTEKVSPAAQRLAELEAENASLRAQLGAQGQGRVAAPAQTFYLTEANRQELEQRGFTTVGGVLLGTDEVRARLKDTDQAGVQIADAPEDVQASADATLASVRRDDQGSQYGVTHVYPSVEPGKLDPAVAGQPGISGPAATDK